MKKLTIRETQQINGGGFWSNVKNGLYNFKEGFKEGLHGW